MNVSIVDLRYHMKEVLAALGRGESVKVHHHKELKGTLIPATQAVTMKVEEHPFFGMSKENAEESVENMMQKLRRGRYDDL